jgi:thioredoxin 1
MKPWLRWTILAVVFVAALSIIIFKGDGRHQSAPEEIAGGVESETDAVMADSLQEAGTSLPRLLELGSVGCKACQMMAPLIDSLREEYAGRLSVEFYDVREDPAPARMYGIRIIPTQIFIDAEGTEIFRHEGFFPREEILPILAKMGVTD